MEEDPNNTVELNGIVEVDELQLEIKKSEEAEARERALAPAKFDAAIEKPKRFGSEINPLRQSCQVMHKESEKDELLRY